ncbi:MAG TPA: alpha/beta fold hydrolase [Polyangiaceae bacterium]|jgi:pimeloyl-ACP methyl ester carboxylesterase|nr:alpha/beta fold hydrolase [Polyangiaceae bacterium]
MSSTRPEVNRPALLFLHGFSLDHRMWRRQVEALHPEYRVITVDLPGFGPQARDCGLVSPAEQVERALDRAGVMKAHVIGHSVGAAVAVDFAFLHPRRVTSLTLAGPLMLGRRTGIEAWGRCVSLANEGDVHTALDVWLDDPLYEGLRRHDELFEEVRNIVLDYGAAHWLGRVTNRWSDPDPFPRLEELPHPALVVTGSLEIPSFKAMADAYVKGLPSARREELEDVGHLVNIEAAEAFNDHLRDFVRHVEKG